jgi:hypothetical protein
MTGGKPVEDAAMDAAEEESKYTLRTPPGKYTIPLRCGTREN